MNKTDKEIDALIHEALNKEEAEYFDKLGEQNVPQMLSGLFTGKNSWLNIYVIVFQLLIFGATIWTFTEFLAAEEMIPKMEWMFYSLVGWVAMAMLKQFSWNQMDKNQLKREIKRLEYQVSLLGKRD